MPDAKPVRMWGVWNMKWNHIELVTEHRQHAIDEVRQAIEEYGDHYRVIPGTFTPDEEGSDGQE